MDTLKEIKLLVAISTETAIRLGLPKSGNIAWPVGGVVDGMTPEQREWLAENVRYFAAHSGRDESRFVNSYTLRTLPYDEPSLDLTSEPSDDTVRAAILAQMEIAATRAAQVEETTQLLLSLPFEAWFTRKGDKRIWPLDTIPYNADVDKDERIAARREEADAAIGQLLRATAATEAATAAAAAAEAATAAAEAKQAKEAAQSRVNKRWQEWVATSPCLLPERIRRAARDGIDVRSAVKAEFATAAKSAILSCTAPFGGEIVGTYGHWPCEHVPSNNAYSILDTLTEHKSDLAGLYGVEGWEWTVGPVVQVDISSTREKVVRTAVQVKGTHEWLGGLRWFVLTEPANFDEENEEDDED